MASPIVLFVYNRSEKTSVTLESLKNNILSDKSDLYIYSDGPGSESEVEKVNEVRKVISKIKGFNSVTIILQDKNLGLAQSVIKGVSDIVNKYGKVIVLEDDIKTSPYFLKYMNDALELYEREESVISIHGYVYPVKEKLPESFFLKGADCWGWATWKRGWDLFEPDGEKLLQELKRKNLSYHFDFNGSYPYFKMLKDQVEGRIDSWAIRWYASAFLKNKYTLYPGKSFVENIGTDGSGIHCIPTDDYDSLINPSPVELKKIPVVESELARKAFENFFKPGKINLITKFLGAFGLKSNV